VESEEAGGRHGGGATGGLKIAGGLGIDGGGLFIAPPASPDPASPLVSPLVPPPVLLPPLVLFPAPAPPPAPPSVVLSCSSAAKSVVAAATATRPPTDIASAPPKAQIRSDLRHRNPSAPEIAATSWRPPAVHNAHGTQGAISFIGDPSPLAACVEPPVPGGEGEEKIPEGGQASHAARRVREPTTINEAKRAWVDRSSPRVRPAATKPVDNRKTLVRERYEREGLYVNRISSLCVCARVPFVV